MKTLAWLLALAAVLYVGGCSATSVLTERGIASLQPGDRREAVIDALGAPDVTEPRGQPFSRYASAPCSGTCVERLWYENPFLPHIEAWSVELDGTGHVVRTSHWASP